ncbi:hypothetical protein KR52_03610 [Synechococcus sp. KORDI-52]|uniref:type II secretion system protein GspD n=1 Tax=Synechococcus sp. KORDI-52 TaxID=585425 RepID=UPI0004E05C46|nr:secretin N-terminal domain-containing protein [Synechococcus sp. KORDI-52]AII48242.1 hypothetical protein KR52_03610 [Synechococcus sp. KORDI-52]
MPELGLKSIRLSQNSDFGFDLAVQSSHNITLTQPRISANGEELIVSFQGLSAQGKTSTSAQLDLRRPGRVAQPSFVPPLRSRASAPPLGDMAVGSMLVSPNNVLNISGPPVSMILNNAPAKDALMALSKVGGFNFVYVDSLDSGDQEPVVRPVSVVFKNEVFGRALNSILLSSGLEGRLEGRTLLVGKSLQNSSFAPQMSKVFRLNQVKPETAANYLSSLGAKMTKVIEIKVTTGSSASLGTTELSNQVSQATGIESSIETLEAQVGPLNGLVGTTDGRLGSVTLVGEPRLIALAESYLKQIDLRKRQVAVKVQIINVDLDNDKRIDSSFSSRMGNTFIVSDKGKAFINFGDYKPGGVEGTGIYGSGDSGVPGTYARYGEEPQQRVIDPVAQRQLEVPNYEVAQERFINSQGEVEFRDLIDSSGRKVYFPSTDPNSTQTRTVLDSNGQPIYVSSTDPTAEQVRQPVYDENGRLKYVPRSDLRRQPDNSFYSYLEAQIESRSAKILAEPTLLVGEGQISEVKTGLEVFTNVETEIISVGDITSENTTFETETAGITLSVGVDRIDDNGFVTMDITPKISLPVLAGQNDGVNIFNLDSRQLSASGIRLRDGQTLVITGVMSDQQVEEVRKWPLLGDLPLIGSLFRGTTSVREKRELVIVVTPQILDDEQGGEYGYGYYRPETPDVRRVLRTF